jgi:hypothetical protein
VLFSKSFERPGPKSVSAATNCSGVAVVVALKRSVAMVLLPVSVETRTRQGHPIE